MRAAVAVVALACLPALPALPAFPAYGAGAPDRAGAAQLAPAGVPVLAECTFAGTMQDNRLQVVFAGVAAVTEPGLATSTSITCRVSNRNRSGWSTTVTPGPVSATAGDTTLAMAPVTVCVTAVVTWIDLTVSSYADCTTPAAP